VRVIVASMTDEPLYVSLEVPGAGAATVRPLDERSVYLAATDQESFRASTQPIEATNGSVHIDLPPFGLATVDTELGAA
jgi:hypothetical protein